jgi:hypothetical protein
VWTNFPDLQLGVIDASRNAQKLIAVRYFSTTANYAVGDFVVQAGALYVATAVVAPGAFNAANWSKMVNAADVAALPYLPLAGGTMTGPLALSGPNMLALIGAAGAQRSILAGTGAAGSASYRWQLVLADQTAESGANAGSNFVLNALSDSGAQISTPLTIARATGAATFGAPVTLSGPPTLPLHAATKAYVDSGAFVPIAGGTMTGPLVLAANPAAPLQPTTKQYVDALPVAMNDNRLINGDMRIDQRNAGASGTAINVYTADRWYFQGTQAGKGTWQRYGNTSNAANGFYNTLGFSSTSAYAVATGDIFNFQQRIEADQIADLAWGTANAQPATLSFWATSTLTGTFGGAISTGGGATRSYPFTYSIPVVNTWTRIAVTIPGDTAAGWTMNGNTEGARLFFDLGAGSTFRAPAGAWAAGNYTGANGTVSVVGTNGAVLNISGVKLEIGSIATPFNRQSLAKSLADCQRYYQSFAQIMAGGYSSAGAAVNCSSMAYPVAMRASPTVNLGAPVYGNASALAVNLSDNQAIRLQFTMTTAGPGYAVAYPLTLSAEL